MFPPVINNIKLLNKLNSIHSSANPIIFNKMKIFYNKVPKISSGLSGSSESVIKGKGYYYNHFIKNSSAKPVLHFISIMMLIGYSINLSQGISLYIYLYLSNQLIN